MAEDCRVVLHLGAHKTASTHLQQALKRARAGLAARVFVPDDLRKDGLKLQDWLHPSVEDAAHEGALRAAFAGPGRLLISEENILGQAPGAGQWADPALYPRAAERLAKLGRVLPAPPSVLALAVREGAGFLAACYSQALMAGRVKPFAQAFGHMDPAALDWDGLLAGLMAAAPGAQAVVWDHADWPAVAPQVAVALLGPGARPLPLPAGLAHPGLSAPAVAALLQAAPPEGEAARILARGLRARFPKGGGHPPFAPHAAAARERAAAAHAALLARLAVRPGVTVLRPG
jgi:hypothetical protein